MTIAENIYNVRSQIEAACARRDRNPKDVSLMAVTKTVEPARIAEAAAGGIRLFGENRVQEMADKRSAVAGIQGEWHLIGHLQSNKAGKAVELFNVIDSLDGLETARRLNRVTEKAGRMLPVMIEINVGREPQKHGVAPEKLRELLRACSELPRLEVIGLMAIPPAVAVAEHARRYFAAMRELSERFRPSGTQPDETRRWELSMGMSHDFAVAVEEGATMVRVGSAIFGRRPPGAAGH
jgi:pyridoxal phosphate enzyme (YggS family)